jgi:hypothetical protein
MEAVKPKTEREIGMAVPNRIALGEHARNVHVYTAESSEHPEDFTKPEFWALVSTKFQPFDHIEIRTDDGTYWAEYLVIAAERTWAKVHKLRDVRLQPLEQTEVDPEFKVEWKGRHLKFCVIRLSDKSIVHEGEQEKSGASRWLEDYVRTIGRRTK